MLLDATSTTTHNANALAQLLLNDGNDNNINNDDDDNDEEGDKATTSNEETDSGWYHGRCYKVENDLIQD